jgi:hypothetical protein
VDLDQDRLGNQRPLDQDPAQLPQRGAQTGTPAALRAGRF